MMIGKMERFLLGRVMCETSDLCFVSTVLNTVKRNNDVFTFWIITRRVSQKRYTYFYTHFSSRYKAFVPKKSCESIHATKWYNIILPSICSNRSYIKKELATTNNIIASRRKHRLGRFWLLFGRSLEAISRCPSLGVQFSLIDEQARKGRITYLSQVLRKQDFQRNRSLMCRTVNLN